MPVDSQTVSRAGRRLQVGLPEGVVSVLPGGSDVGEALVRHPGIDKIAFTGSSATGRRIAALCGGQLKRVSLELGGKSAAIVLDDADIGKTVAGLKTAGLMNNGQACVAQTRILVNGNNVGCRTTSGPDCGKVLASSSAATTIRPNAAGTCGRRCLPTRPTACASLGRRYSAQS
jgi:aldehyde dehydrogenase (NAD+)